VPRITAIPLETATGRAKDLLDAVKHQLGLVPNMTRAMAYSPAALDGYLQLSGALAKGALPAKVREQIALAVAEANGCDYCLAAHSAVGKAVGLTGEQLRDARRADPVDPRTAAVVRFARRLVDTRGRVTDAELAAVRAAGWDDGTIAEVVANVALNIFTNYFNEVAEADLDFPKAPELSPPSDPQQP
jgi:uncharacterized peroxidase-related enzyme